ncbi:MULTISPECIES: tripartite tricarboxylate transporter TctB family protein [unclassified Cytobacillus]|uniref:tripartite tricarboxylate transporter TctB family protein n=1 Tax=unclassified Cytobacillus TaxID=2675268 RepID=UPI0020402F96|nr:tripartite tricarboxylate transporter TctB family protein [Cytobacillus sp. AMY 15.2]MCM3093253.1 tripartite tricarboxylate transporter TctB family protein [Cytobacillus sp. AMY 15.2]
MRKKCHQDIYISFVMFIISVFLYIQTFNMIEEAALFPRILLLLFTAFGIFILIGGIKKTKSLQNGQAETYEGDEEALDLRILKAPITTVIIVGIYVLLMNFIGFFPATILFMASFLAYMKVKSWKGYVFTIGGLNLFVYLVFVIQLNVQLPAGIFFE